MPDIVELGEHLVHYDPTIAHKLDSDASECIYYERQWVSDEMFPDVRTGSRRYKASAVRFGEVMHDDDVAAWCAANKKICAWPKEGIDIIPATPRPKLDEVMPLALAGQFFVGGDGVNNVLYFDGDSKFRNLKFGWVGPKRLWGRGWWFLVLEEIPSVV